MFGYPPFQNDDTYLIPVHSLPQSLKEQLIRTLNHNHMVDMVITQTVVRSLQSIMRAIKVASNRLPIRIL